MAGLGLASEAGAATNLDLRTAANVRVDGAEANDYSGNAVAGAGDVNGDGRDDVIVGARGAGNNSRFSSGSSYVISVGPTVRTSTSLPSALRGGSGSTGPRDTTPLAIR